MAKWGVYGQRSYMWLLDLPDPGQPAGGYLSFDWTTNGGSLEYLLHSTSRSPNPGLGVPLFVGMSTTRSGAVRTGKFGILRPHQLDPTR